MQIQSQAVIFVQVTPAVTPVANLAALQAAALQQPQASDNPILTAAKRAAGQIAAKVSIWSPSLHPQKLCH